MFSALWNMPIAFPPSMRFDLPQTRQITITSDSTLDATVIIFPCGKRLPLHFVTLELSQVPRFSATYATTTGTPIMAAIFRGSVPHDLHRHHHLYMQPHFRDTYATSRHHGSRLFHARHYYKHLHIAALSRGSGNERQSHHGSRHPVGRDAVPHNVPIMDSILQFLFKSSNTTSSNAAMIDLPLLVWSIMDLEPNTSIATFVFVPIVVLSPRHTSRYYEGFAM